MRGKCTVTEDPGLAWLNYSFVNALQSLPGRMRPVLAVEGETLGRLIQALLSGLASSRKKVEAISKAFLKLKQNIELLLVECEERQRRRPKQTPDSDAKVKQLAAVGVTLAEAVHVLRIMEKLASHHMLSVAYTQIQMLYAKQATTRDGMFPADEAAKSSVDRYVPQITQALLTGNPVGWGPHRFEKYLDQVADTAAPTARATLRHVHDIVKWILRARLIEAERRGELSDMGVTVCRYNGPLLVD